MVGKLQRIHFINPLIISNWNYLGLGVWEQGRDAVHQTTHSNYGLPLRSVPWLLPVSEGAFLKFWLEPGGPICGLWISAFCTSPVKFASCRSMCSTRIRCSSSGLRCERKQTRPIRSQLHTFVGHWQRAAECTHPANPISATIKPCLYPSSQSLRALPC